MNPDLQAIVRGGSWVNDREPYHRVDMGFFPWACLFPAAVSFRVFRPLRIPSRLPVMPPRTLEETLTRWWVT